MGRKDIKNGRQKPYRQAMSDHHRKPRSQGGGSNPENISRVTRLKHTAWHILFRNWIVEHIAREINEWFLDPAYVMVAIKKSAIEQYDPAYIKLIAEKTLSEAKKSSR